MCPGHHTHGSLRTLEKPIEIKAWSRRVGTLRNRIRESIDTGRSHSEDLSGRPHYFHGLEGFSVIVDGIGWDLPLEVIRDDRPLGRRQEGHDHPETLLLQFLGELSPRDASLYPYTPVVRINCLDLIHPAQVQHDTALPGAGSTVEMDLRAYRNYRYLVLVGEL